MIKWILPAQGNEPGTVLPDFTAECLDGTEFRLEDTKGKVVFINLWATYCAPCVKELPDFCSLYDEHAGDIAVLAVHSSQVVTDVNEYVDGMKWSVPVCVDDADSTIFGIVGGSSMLPQTIVLDREGRVIYNQTGSVDREKLERLYEEASR